MREIKDGDIYAWGYLEKRPDDGRDYGRYHCKSRIAIARDGFLVDTYWCGGGLSDKTYCSYADAPMQWELTYLGNLAELENVPEYKAMYYDDADLVNLNHSNSSKGNFYVRKGAKRSREKMRVVLTARIEETERQIKYACERLARDQDLLVRIKEDADLDEIHL